MPDLTRISAATVAIPKAHPTVIEARLAAAAVEPSSPQKPLYLDSTFCQIYFPHRDPGEERVVRRENGNLTMELAAGKIIMPGYGINDIRLGLPWGPKARVILMYLSQRALLTHNPVINVEENLSTFVHLALKQASYGRNCIAVKEQLSRLAGTSLQITRKKDERSVVVVNGYFIHGCEMWLEGRVVWPKQIVLSQDYFHDLNAHAVPLVEDHIRALSHNAMALDIYAWLAHRLHRIARHRPQQISWLRLWGQFGHNYELLFNFRRDFRKALKQVLILYKKAHVEEGVRGQRKVYIESSSGMNIVREPARMGLTLYHSEPPVSKKFISLDR
jgi:hypothetical protein